MLVAMLAGSVELKKVPTWTEGLPMVYVTVDASAHQCVRQPSVEH